MRRIVPRNALLPLALAALILVAGCRRAPSPDPVIADDIARYLDASPLPEPPACADAAAATGRLEPVLLLLADVYAARSRWEEPLPDELAARAAEADLTRAIGDFRCLARDAGTPPDVMRLLGAYGALLTDRAAALFDAGETDDAWRHLTAALELFDDASVFAYLHRFSAFWVFGRVEESLREHGPPTEPTNWSLEKALDAALMPRAGFCAGLREEFLSQAIAIFSGHVASLREPILARYRPVQALFDPFPAIVFRDNWGMERYPPRAVWEAYRALFEPLLRDCLAGDPRAMHAAAAPRLEALAELRPEAARVLEMTVGRLRDYADLVDAQRQAKAALGGGS